MKCKIKAIAAPLFVAAILIAAGSASATLCSETAWPSGRIQSSIDADNVFAICDLDNIRIFNSEVYKNRDSEILRSVCSSLDLTNADKADSYLTAAPSQEFTLLVSSLVRTVDWNGFGLTYDKRIFAGTNIQI